MVEVLTFKWGKDVVEPHRDKLDELEVEEIDIGVYKVVGKTKEYTVTVYSISDKEYAASCECDYFKHKKRVCKHIVKVLFDAKVYGLYEIPEAPEEEQQLLTNMGFVRGDQVKSEEEAKGQATVQVIQDRLEDKIAEIADDFDSKQIVLDLTGSYEELPMIYEFVDKQGNKRTVVSWAGYTKAALIQGNIKVEFCGFSKTPDGKLVAEAKAIDLKRNVEVYGVASRLPQTKFPYEVLASKAARNALKRVIDPDIIAKVITHAKQSKSVQEIPLREAASP